MKYLIVGLGNIGAEYEDTRHNIGFKVLDELANSSSIFFTSDRLASRAELKYKGRTFILIKPTTYMNLSGKAVNYWMQEEKIPADRVLVITDDINLPFGKVRIRRKGSDGGHNGLKNINQVLGHQNYPRMRFGVGDDFYKGRQVEYVLGKWSHEELKHLPERLILCHQAILAFGTIGVERMMNEFNNK
ncbi:MAG: aminoacyl-tRNA hydrolase [Crocinitomicaceae bacterium]|nr:aminoacyl-tRNA hydrolase [Crocinitomicaceae bacterium]|tara:strand:- start:420 stop:983 length:564 start_codon:yes stop_codon:yes gene_type:complete